jgi:hypothetical protein
MTMKAPVSVLLAGFLAASTAGLAAQQQAANAPAAPTPRTADGKPDLSGIWGGRGGGGAINANAAPVDDDRVVALLRTRAPDIDKTAPVGTDANYAHAILNFERDSGLSQRAVRNRPMYKPEHWEKINQLDKDGNAADPAFRCLPEGVPRMGPPEKIVQTPKELIFLYGMRMTRIIPIDGRPMPPVADWVGLWNGVSRGRWEGDELVIETVDFNDETWLGWPGWIHSIDMKVTERIRREGNMLRWQATVEDPFFLQPWVMAPRMIRLNPNPDAELEEDLPCFERDLQHMVTKERG